MRHAILIVNPHDDDDGMIAFEVARNFPKEQVNHVHSWKEAENLLEDIQFKVCIINPFVDGEFIQYILGIPEHRSHFIFLADPIQSPPLKALLNVGNVSFISRPVQVDGLMTTIRHLNETYMARAHFFTGTLYQITPIELIQLKLASQAKTLLAFTSTGRLVCVYIDKGRITGAMLFEQENDEYPKIVGREAIFELVKWPGGNFVETMGVDLPEECERLEESSGQLLLAALHVYDENVHQEDGESHSKDLKAI